MVKKIRNVTKNLAGMEDLQPVRGPHTQVRNNKSVVVHGIDVPYAVGTAAEMADLDVSRWTHARIYSAANVYVDYLYDPDYTLGVPSTVGAGSWRVALSSDLADNSFKTFDSLASAVTYIVANPDGAERVQTASNRTQAECLSLGIDYPDGNGADYIVTTGETVTPGLVIAAGVKQLKLITQKINKPLDTIADLRSFRPTVGGQTVEVLGHTLAGIGGGQFYYDPDDTTSADNNGTVIVTSSGERWKREPVGFATPEAYGAMGDGVVDDTTALQAAVGNEKTVCGSPNSTYRLTAALSMNGLSGFTLFSDDSSTVFNIDYGGRLMNLAGYDITIKGFTVKSTATVAITSQGVINIDNISVPSNGITLDDITFDCPNHGMNAVLAKGQAPSGLIDGLIIKNCRVKNIGRMGFEVLAQATNTEIYGNTINNTGVASAIFGMGVSMSGDNLESSSVHDNHIGNCPFSCVEVVGTQKGIKIHDNTFFGTNAALISNTNVPIAEGLSIQGNTSEPSTYSIVKIHSSKDALITGNTFYVTRLDIASDGAVVRGNNIFSNQATAVIIDNHPNCIVEDNLVDNSVSGSNNAVIRCFNTGAILNTIKNNRIRKASGGLFIDNNSGATQNIFKANENADSLAPADNSPEINTLSDISASTFVTVDLLSSIAAGSRRTGQFRITVSGTTNAGTDSFAGQVIVVVKMRDEATVFTLIAESVVFATNMAFNTSMVTGGFNVEAAAASGTGQQLTWYVEDLTTGRPVSSSLVNMKLVATP